MEENLSLQQAKKLSGILVLNVGNMADIGLLKGKIGIALFLYEYARYGKQEKYTQFADSLIDDVFEEINIGMPLGFENGLIGVAWGIEYLVQNGFLEADTNEVFEDIDKAVYWAVKIDPDLWFAKDDFFSAGLYYCIRSLKKGNSIVNDEFYPLLIKYCQQSLESKLNEAKSDKDRQPTVGYLNSVLLFLLCLTRNNLQFDYKSIAKLLSSCIGISIEASSDILDRTICLSLIQNFIGFYPNAAAYFTEIQNILQTENTSTTCVEKSGTELFNLMSKTTWTKFVYPDFFEDTVYREICDNGIHNICNAEKWDKLIEELNHKNLGLNNGLAGIGLAMITRLRQQEMPAI